MSRPHNRDLIVRLYRDEGWSVPRIAKEIGAHKSAIYRHLDAAGVKRRDDRLTLPGRPRYDYCGRGVHKLEGDNVRVDANGHRHCRACARTQSAIRNFIRSQEAW